MREPSLPIRLMLCFSIFFAGSTSGCAADEESPSGAARSIPFETLGKGTNSRIEKPLQEVIKSPEKWQSLWRRIQAPGDPPNINFSESMVVLVAMGTQRTGGYSIQVSKVREEKGKIIVSYQAKKPGPGAITTQALTSPFHVVKLQRSELPVVFEEVSAPPPNKDPKEGSRPIER